MRGRNKFHAEGIRFSNIHILDAMEQIVTRHIRFYQSDFYNYDISTIKNAVDKTMIAGRRFLWLPRRCGTYLFYGIDVITRIPQRKAFNYYFEQHNDTLLFTIEVGCGNSDPDSITGDLFALDYGDEYQRMQQYTFSSDGDDIDNKLYEAIQRANRRRMMAYPEGDLALFLKDIDIKSTGVA